jgi:cellobiose phosphorylase
LLPFNRGIISQLFNPEDIAHYRAIINQHLRHPDGVRLMDTAVQYRGGKKTYFQRAETAANFGREIGIQYVHAHIRYIEAMCQLGDGQEAWWGLNVIHPIQIQQTVRHAAYRQSNVYFSSSDAAFFDRYQAKKEFEKIRQGTIPVKAGWRLYSSGPGIYLHQLITKFFGIRYEHGLLVVDPVIPDIFKDLLVTYKQQDQPLKIHYQFKNQIDSMHHRYRKTYHISKINLSTHILIEL